MHGGNDLPQLIMRTQKQLIPYAGFCTGHDVGLQHVNKVEQIWVLTLQAQVSKEPVSAVGLG